MESAINPPVNPSRSALIQMHPLTHHFVHWLDLLALDADQLPPIMYPSAVIVIGMWHVSKLLQLSIQLNRRPPPLRRHASYHLERWQPPWPPFSAPSLSSFHPSQLLPRLPSLFGYCHFRLSSPTILGILLKWQLKVNYTVNLASGHATWLNLAKLYIYTMPMSY